MGLLPLELVLTIGASTAVFALGVIAWLRNRWATGTVLYALMAVALSVWTSADWFLLQQSGVPALFVLGWKAFFYVLTCFAPAVAIHASSSIANRPFRRGAALGYAVGGVTFSLFVTGLAAASFGFLGEIAPLLIEGGAVLGAAFTVVAIMVTGAELYPLLHARHAPELTHRRAAYGLMIIVPFLAACLMQFMTGPLPVGLLMPFLATWFLTFSLAGFSRASFLDVEFGALEAFFLLLSAFSAILVLRSENLAEILTAVTGSFLVGVFGLLAIWSVGREREKRRLVEAANRELQYLEHAKNDFLDMVAHQLRGPLGGIRASAEMLATGDYGALPDRARSASGQIESSAARLLSLAETFLDASRLDAGNYRSERVVTDVRAITEEVIAEIRDAASSKGLQFNATIDPSVPKQLKIDEEVLRQTLFNLLDNAVKYTASGDVTARVRVQGPSLCIEVRDTGIGFSEDERKELFKKFHRGQSTHVRAVQGTGLGLYIIRRLAEAAGGRIEAESAGTGSGSVFRAFLPFDPA